MNTDRRTEPRGVRPDPAAASYRGPVQLECIAAGRQVPIALYVYVVSGRVGMAGLA